MFPTAHVVNSALRRSPATPGQLVGAVLPDSAQVGLMSWELLKLPSEVARFIDACGPELDDLVAGITHHVELDVRSHDEWLGGGGYAFARQTYELCHAVGEAFGLEGEAVGHRAHNIIECAVDLHLLAEDPNRLRPLVTAIEQYDTSDVVAVITELTQNDVVRTRELLASFLNIWTTNDLSTKAGMIQLWSKLHKGEPVSEQPLLDAIDLALELTADDFLDVIAS